MSVGKFVHVNGTIDLSDYPQEFKALFLEALITRVWHILPEFQKPDEGEIHSMPFIL